MTKIANQTSHADDNTLALNIIGFTVSSEVKRRDLLLKTLTESDEFCRLLQTQNIRNISLLDKGGFSFVCNCVYGDSATESVLKLSSYRCLSDEKSSTLFDDITQNIEFGRLVLSYYIRERYAYDSLREERKQTLAKPFIVAIHRFNDNGNDEIYDYVFCVNIPKYQKIENVIGQNCDEMQVLKIAYDVLEQLTDVHTEGVRHRDIKMQNIMYDEVERSFVLIDWGSSCRLSDQTAERFIYNKKRTDVCTPIYVDPLRFDSDERKANSVVTDLFSIGVLMAYMIHEQGYNVGNSIEEFYNIVCPGEVAVSKDGKQIPTLCAKNIYDILTNKAKDSEEFAVECSETRRVLADIVRKAMNHNVGYETTGEMLTDVKKTLGIREQEQPNENKEEKKPKKKKTFELNSVVSFVPLLFVVIYTLFISGEKGMNSVISDKENIALSLISSVVLLVIAISGFLRIEANKVNVKKVSIKKESLIESVVFVFATFFVLTLPVSVALKNLQISYPLCFNSLQMAVAIITYTLAEKRFGDKAIIWGCTIAGLLSALSVVVCIGKKIGDCLGIVIAMIVVGILWSLIFVFCAFSYRTRLIRKR